MRSYSSKKNELNIIEESELSIIEEGANRKKKDLQFQVKLDGYLS